MNKRGQITIFMILGIVLLVVFLFLIFIVNSTQKANLLAEQAKAFETIYPREGLNLYLDNCLKDSLKDAITAIEQQGRLWRDINPGGFIPFEEGKSGVRVNGIPIAYGLTFLPFPNSLEAYPCDDENGKPAFCKYSYPDATKKFGSLALLPSTLEEDIKRFMVVKVISCAEQLAAKEIAPDAVAEVINPIFAVTLQDNGVAVDAKIPFYLMLRGIRYFATSTFRFFYDTALSQVVKTAAYFPLQADRDYVDFDYSKDTLTNRNYYFGSSEDGGSCHLESTPPKKSDPLKIFYNCSRKLVAGYSSLGVDMEKTPLDKGDTLFSFFSPYVKYAFVRQNRPPALNYISRFACPTGEYDYLAIASDASSLDSGPVLSYPELQKIDITATAFDPDEQNNPELNIIDVSSEAAPNSLSTPSIVYGGSLADEDDSDKKHFFVSAPLPGRYVLRATANDEYLKEKLQDKQDVRVLVDNPIETSIDTHHDYGDLPKKTPDTGIALVSPEDPIIVDVQFPQKSLTGILGNFDFLLTIGGVQRILSGLLPSQDKQTAGINHFIFPYDSTKQPNLIKTITDSSQFAYSLVTTQDVKQPGTLMLDYSLNYCGNNLQTSQSTAAVTVVPCLPHRNEEHPFPFPYENYRDENKDGIADAAAGSGGLQSGQPVFDKLAAFAANHTCCLSEPNNLGSWRIAQPKDNIACFKKNVDKNEARGCFGDNNKEEKSYILEIRTTEVHYCDGLRGNTCDDENKNYKFESIQQNSCGNKKEHQSCHLVADECQDREPFTKGVDKKGKGFWCNGPVGCGDKDGEACTTEIMTNVKGLGFDNLKDKKSHYTCGCDSEEFGKSSNHENDCWNLKENKQGTCQKTFNSWKCDVS